jgi:hypothetical protein
MSLSANIEHLAIASGIEAVCVETAERDFRGRESWKAVLDGALDLFGKTEESSIRLVVGKHTVVVQREAAETVAVVLPTGHAIAKSLRRMIRRMAKKDRGPLPKAALEPAVVAPAPEPLAAAPSPPSIMPVGTPTTF